MVAGRQDTGAEDGGLRARAPNNQTFLLLRRALAFLLVAVMEPIVCQLLSAFDGDATPKVCGFGIIAELWGLVLDCEMDCLGVERLVEMGIESPAVMKTHRANRT